jgi:hypothetical protein
MRQNTGMANEKLSFKEQHLQQFWGKWLRQEPEENQKD